MTDQLDQLKKLAELQGKATPGVWRTSDSQSSSTTRIIADSNAEVAQIKYLDAYCGYGTINGDNAKYIAASRNIDLPALVAYVEGLESALEFYKELENCSTIHITSLVRTGNATHPIQDDGGNRARQALKQEG